MDDTPTPVLADEIAPDLTASVETVSDLQAVANESPHESSPPPPLLKLVGVGGAGVNIVSRISAEPLETLSFAVMDCDARKLGESPVAEKWILGEGQRRGLSAGGELELGRQAAEASRDKLARAGGGADLLFLVAGLGGGTGSAAAPLVAAEASKAGGLVIGFAVLPFSFEGGRRAKQAEAALVSLRRACDAVIVLPNDLLLQETSEDASALTAFEQADEWIARAVRALWRLLCKTGLMNVDFAALQRAFEYRGSKTVFGLGSGTGENVGDEVLASLRACPLMHAPETARRADRLLVSVAGGSSVLTLSLVNRLAQAVGEQFGRSAELIVGATIDDTIGERVELCLIGASDIGGRSVRRPVRAEESATENRRVETDAPQESRASMNGRGGTPSSRSEVERGAPSKRRESVNVRGDTPRTRASMSQVTDLQGEFGFSAEATRGYFRDTEATLFDGEDLDPPTYLRKGVKVTV